MEDKKIYKFPMMNDGLLTVESYFCDLLSQERDGKKLDDEEEDWLNWANSVLMFI